MNAPPFLSSGGPWSQPPLPPLPLNPNLSLQNPLNLYMYLSNLASFTPHYHPPFPPNNFSIQNPSFAPKHFSNSAFHPQAQASSQNSKEQLERIDRAVEKARSDLIAAGESVSAWKVSQSTIRILEVDCWSSLGFQMQQVPSLHRLMLTQGKIDAFIHCFVGVRRIASLYDLEVAICENEGVERFEELGLGPLLRNPLVVHYFSVKCDATEVFRITSEEIISLLSEFMDACKHTYIRVEELLDFIVKKCAVASREELGIRIHSLGMHISAIRVARDLESAALKKSGELIIQQPDSRCMKQPMRMQQDEHFTTSIRRQFCGKHIRFDSEDECSDDENNDHVRNNHVNLSSQSAKSSDRVDSDDGLVVSPSQSKGPLNQVNISSQSAESCDRLNTDDGLVVSPSQSKGPLPSLKMQQDKGFSTISCRVDSFFSVHKQFCGKHTRFDLEDEGSDVENNDHVRSNHVYLSSQSAKSSDRVDCDDGLVVSPSQSKGPLNQVDLSSQSAESFDRVNTDDGLVVSPSQSKGPLPSLKMQQDKGFSTISCHVDSFFSVNKQFCGKHIRFDSAENSEDECIDDDLHDEEDYNRDQVTCSVVNISSQSGGRSDRVSSCPYPSAIEEIQRLGLDQLSPDSGSQKHKGPNDSVKKKRKSEIPLNAISMPPKLCRTEKVEQVAQPIENGRGANNVRNLDGRKAESWPPVDWRTAPRYDYACANGFRTRAPILQPRSDLQKKGDDNYDGFVKRTDNMIPVTDTPQWGTSNFGKRDRLSTCTPDAIQAKETGRLGELAAFKYFIEKAGKSAVKWVNEHSETRLPYDIVVGENEDRKEFIEVKATKNPTKDWFEMSVRQLQFAVEQGEAFSIAHVILSDYNVATVRVYNNLEKLLMKHNNQELQDQDCKMKLVVLVLEPQKEFTIVS
ncbi:protein NO VEIN isoform X1 [Rosa rugosa]|uniref:protein NO VEIN isoform X1 n=2 Tax=Rosa rugosa TaxID=74645 RepID=UPI002B4058CF|nr:protein NO VEIN isoform X1 [Rosa rugosa]